MATNGKGPGPFSESNALVNRLERGALEASAEVIESLISDSIQLQTPGFRMATRKLRDRYNSRAEKDVKLELQRRFPNTHQEMPVLETDTIRLAAIQDATVFAEGPPDIEVMEEEREDEEATDALRNALENSDAFDELQEGERWARASRNAVFHMRWDTVSEAIEGEGKVRFTKYWADQVHIVPLWCAPKDERAAVAAVWETQGPDNRNIGPNGVPEGEPEQWWEFWFRSSSVEGDKVSFGPWNAYLVGSESGSFPQFGDGIYPLPTLPLVVMRDGHTEGMYQDPGNALLSMGMAVDLEWCSVFHKNDLSGSPMVFADDPDLEGKGVVGGPGKVIPTKRGTNVTAIAADVNVIGLETVKALRREITTQRRQASDAYEAQSGGPESGFAKQIRNLTPDKAHQERLRQMIRWMQRRFLPLFVEVYDYWGEFDIGHAARPGSTDGSLSPIGELRGISYDLKFPEPFSYEPPNERDARHMARVEKGYESPVDAVVAMGIKETVLEAEEYLSEFGSRLLDGGEAQDLPELGGLEEGLNQALEGVLDEDPEGQALQAVASEDERGGL